MLNSKRIDEATVICQTNAWYTDDGQIIIMRQADETTVQFKDISRGIYGSVQGNIANPSRIIDVYLNSAYSADVNYELDRELGKLAIANKALVPCSR